MCVSGEGFLDRSRSKFVVGLSVGFKSRELERREQSGGVARGAVPKDQARSLPVAFERNHATLGRVAISRGGGGFHNPGPVKNRPKRSGVDKRAEVW